MFNNYHPKNGYDEYFSSDDFLPRSSLEPLLSSLGEMGLDQLNISHEIARKLLLRHGATFRLNDSGNKGSERILPFDPLPRVIGASEWVDLERGLIQRLEAIDLFLADVYGKQQIIKDGIISRDLIESSDGWRPEMKGFVLPLGKWCHVSGLDLIRDGKGEWLVLEDNLCLLYTSPSPRDS